MVAETDLSALRAIRSQPRPAPQGSVPPIHEVLHRARPGRGRGARIRETDPRGLPGSDALDAAARSGLCDESQARRSRAGPADRSYSRTPTIALSHLSKSLRPGLWPGAGSDSSAVIDSPDPGRNRYRQGAALLSGDLPDADQATAIRQDRPRPRPHSQPASG